MEALHCTWTKPRTESCGSFYIEDFDILTTILSALKWREKNGKITMVTDNTGYDFYRSRNLLGIWDEVTVPLDNIPAEIDARSFWAGGKIFALKETSGPIAVIDTDFIVWDKLAFDNMPDLTIIHSEDIYPDVYPDVGHFKMKQGYIFNPDFNWKCRPYNTAFTVIKNDNLKNTFCNEAISFMENAIPQDNLTYMVFAEQRLLSMVAEMTKAEVLEISTIEKLFRDGEKYFTHTWGMKQQMRDDDMLRYDFCKKCIRRISDDFPEYVSIIKEIPELKKYFD